MYCQQTLCTSALFEDLILFLIKKDSGVNLKRMSVYVILVLVSNNSKLGFFLCVTITLLFYLTICSPKFRTVNKQCFGEVNL